jgi:hypothetical protein
MSLPLTFNLLVSDYRGDEETPRSAQYAEFSHDGPPRCQLVIHRTLYTEFILGAFYEATFTASDGAVQLPIKFPNFLFQCSHTDWTDKQGEHALLVAQGGLSPQPASASFWNVERGTFFKGQFYAMVIDFGMREADPKIVQMLRDGKRVDTLVEKLLDGPQPVALPPERFLKENTVAFGL